MMRKFTVFTVLAALPAWCATAAFANGFYVDPRLVVTPLSPTQFEVIQARGEGARGIWCAAALYSINRLGMQRGRIYVSGARGPAQTASGRTGVVFSTEPVGNVGPSVAVTVRQVGSNLPVQHALQFCRADIERNDDF